MAKLTPSQAADKWKRNLQASTTSITQGVDAVTVNPATKAIAQKSKMIQNWNASINDGKWERGLGKVTLAEWKTAMKTKGVQRITAGAEAGMGKYMAYQQEVQPYMENLQNQIDAMPSTTLQDRINRAVAWMSGMADFERNT